MASVSGEKFDLDEVLQNILKSLEVRLSQLRRSSSEEILKEYKASLFRMQVPSTFQLPDGKFFTGIIHDVSKSGKLLVRVEDEKIEEFDLKEIKLCY
jgi:BirA family transcriptional regulator, biotin operon repressor / biotin---[acetyl-CoA-carboxylase] ligase